MAKMQQRDWVQLVPEGCCSQKSWAGFWEGESFFSRVDQGLGFPFAAQALPGVLSPGKQIETEIS